MCLVSRSDEADIPYGIPYGFTGGAGGKGAWGVAGEEYGVQSVAVLNEKDPNYDPEEQEKEPAQPKE